MRRISFQRIVYRDIELSILCVFSLGVDMWVSFMCLYKCALYIF